MRGCCYWLAPGLIALSVYSGWKAEDGHAYVARDSLQTVSGTVTQAAEVTVKRKRRSTKHYYEISVQPDTAVPRCASCASTTARHSSWWAI